MHTVPDQQLGRSIDFADTNSLAFGAINKELGLVLRELSDELMKGKQANYLRKLYLKFHKLMHLLETLTHPDISIDAIALHTLSNEKSNEMLMGWNTINSEALFVMHEMILRLVLVLDSKTKGNIYNPSNTLYKHMFSNETSDMLFKKAKKDMLNTLRKLFDHHKLELPSRNGDNRNAYPSYRNGDKRNAYP